MFQFPLFLFPYIFSVLLFQVISQLVTRNLVHRPVFFVIVVSRISKKHLYLMQLIQILHSYVMAFVHFLYIKNVSMKNQKCLTLSRFTAIRSSFLYYLISKCLFEYCFHLNILQVWNIYYLQYICIYFSKINIFQWLPVPLISKILLPTMQQSKIIAVINSRH